MKNVLVCIPLMLLLAGCAGPAPVPLKGGLSLLCWYNPRTYVTVIPGITNTVDSTQYSRETASSYQPVQPTQSGGVCVAFDNLVTLTCGGGTSASNTVPVSFSFNKQ